VLEKLNKIEKKYESLQETLSRPEVIENRSKYQEYAKALAEITPLAEKIGQYKKILANIEVAEELLGGEKEPDMSHYLKEERDSLLGTKESLEKELKEMLLPKDELEDKDIIMEIRAGTGGEEASLFAADLFRMYVHYTQNKGLKTQIMSSHPSESGGFKEIIFEVKGRKAYRDLKYESGVHRVQRVPATESGGRIHTSTATVAVLAEAEEVDVKIDPRDLQVDTYRSAGPGGQHVNVTDSAVRITHKPSGLVVSCQEERSQFQNKERALKILRSRLYELMRREQQKEIDQARRLQVGTGERSEKIRTYNFPQNRVTDHRVSLTVHNLDAVLEGNLDQILEALAAWERMEKLREVG